MKRKSCIKYNMHDKNFPKGCRLKKICKNFCEHYQRKGKNMVRYVEGKKLSKKQLAKIKREETAFKNAIRDPFDKSQNIKKFKEKKKIVSEHLECPNCKNNKIEDIIRLRDSFYNCRICNFSFVKEDIIDEFDSDGLEE